MVEKRLLVSKVESLYGIGKLEVVLARVLLELKVKRVVTSDIVDGLLDVVTAVRLEVKLTRVLFTFASKLGGDKTSGRADTANRLAVAVLETCRELSDGDETLKVKVIGVDRVAGGERDAGRTESSDERQCEDRLGQHLQLRRPGWKWMFEIKEIKWEGGKRKHRTQVPSASRVCKDPRGAVSAAMDLAGGTG